MALPAKRFNDETIDSLTRYLQAGGEDSGIMLSDKQLVLLDRIRFADEKIRENKYKREDIANFIKSKYGICRDTAFKDIVIAEAVFSSSYPLNKKNEIQLRVEYLKKKINDAYIDKDVFNAVGLEKQLREYLKMYPDYAPPRSPKNITYIINGDIHQTQNNLTVLQAADDAEALIKKLEENDDY